MLVNVSSVQGKIGTPLEGAYAASKHALEALSESLYFELGHFGIRVVIIEPGYIAPGMKHDDDHPGPAVYADLHAQWSGTVATLTGPAGRPGPELVGLAVADALEDPATPLRVEVGPGRRHGAAAAADAERRRVRGHHARGARAHVVRGGVDVEKLMYLAWLEPDSTRSEVAEVMLGRVGEELLALDPVRPDHRRLGPRERHPGPGAHARGRDAPARARLAVGRLHRAAGAVREVLEAAAVRVAGYSVVESLYRDYGGNQWAAPRSWPDGERSPGVLTVALLQQHPDQTFDEWITRWHTRISPITEEIQPRTRYVRNAVFRPITDGRPDRGGDRGGGLALPGARHRSHAVLLRGRRPERMNAHVTQMIEEINAFVDLSTLRSVTMSEWILKS